MATRRRFIQIVPLAGAALLAACSRTPEPAAAPPAPAPAAPPEPAPVAAAPAPAAAPASDTAAAPAAPPAPAAATGSLPMVDEKDPQAMALGYVDDSSRADKVRFKNYIAGSQCSTCALFQGKAGDASGPCPLYAGKSVSAKGWCSGWNKKA